MTDTGLFLDNRNIQQNSQKISNPCSILTSFFLQLDLSIEIYFEDNTRDKI